VGTAVPLVLVPLRPPYAYEEGVTVEYATAERLCSVVFSFVHGVSADGRYRFATAAGLLVVCFAGVVVVLWLEVDVDLVEEVVCFAEEVVCLTEEVVCFAEEVVYLTEEVVCFAEEVVYLTEEVVCFTEEVVVGFAGVVVEDL